MELGSLPAEAGPPDIMQMARTGDLAGMEKLFEDGEHDATYTDDEGITPLHVRQAPLPSLVRSPGIQGEILLVPRPSRVSGTARGFSKD
jgi:hypothetical protein